jgi:hypothetical protein
MIPHRLWQTSTHKGSSVDRPSEGRLARVWQAGLFQGFVSDARIRNKSEANKISPALSFSVKKCLNP